MGRLVLCNELCSDRRVRCELLLFSREHRACTHTHAYTYMHTRTYTHIHAHTHIYAHTYTYMHPYMRTRAHTHTYTHIHCAHTCTRVHTRERSIHTHACMCTDRQRAAKEVLF